MAPVGFPHSDIRGSKGVCPSPRLFAACRVLRRLPVPRHPPCALSIFSSASIINKCFFAVLRVAIAFATSTSVSLGDLKGHFQRNVFGNNRISIRSSIREEESASCLPALSLENLLLLLLARDVSLLIFITYSNAMQLSRCRALGDSPGALRAGCRDLMISMR